MNERLPLAGMAVVVTGEVPGLDRAQAQAGVTALGGKPMGSVSGKTSLVVVGEGAGVSKMAKVRQHQIPVMTGAAFAALVADPGSWQPGDPVGAPVTEVVAPEPPREPVVLGDHLLSQVVVFANGAREVRMLCSCGHAWLAATIHLSQNGPCPRDPAAAAA